jgi:hypothetical protein
MKMVKDTHISYLNKVMASYPFSVYDKINGSLKVKKVRKYNEGGPHVYEIDIIFDGVIFARLDNKYSEWLTSEILVTHNISKVKVNKIIRRCAEYAIRKDIELFGINQWSFIIKKVEWKLKLN